MATTKCTSRELGGVNQRDPEKNLIHVSARIALSIFFCLALAGATAAQSRTPKSAAVSPSSKVEAIVNEAVINLWKHVDHHWHEGEYRHIVNLCKVIATARPDAVEAYSNAGWLLWSMDADDEALALYEQGLKANPSIYEMYDELGFYYFNRKRDYARAIPYYEKALQFKDCKPFTIHMLAHAYERTKQMDKALKAWERAAAIPDNATGRTNLERFKRKMKQG
jgi:tetratricopeptide (TPR) repeat protein